MLRCEHADWVPIRDFINNPALDKDVFIKEIFIFNGKLAAILSNRIRIRRSNLCLRVDIIRSLIHSGMGLMIKISMMSRELCSHCWICLETVELSVTLHGEIL